MIVCFDRRRRYDGGRAVRIIRKAAESLLGHVITHPTLHNIRLTGIGNLDRNELGLVPSAATHSSGNVLVRPIGLARDERRYHSTVGCSGVPLFPRSPDATHKVRNETEVIVIRFRCVIRSARQMYS